MTLHDRGVAAGRSSIQVHPGMDRGFEHWCDQVDGLQPSINGDGLYNVPWCEHPFALAKHIHFVLYPNGEDHHSPDGKPLPNNHWNPKFVAVLWNK